MSRCECPERSRVSKHFEFMYSEEEKIGMNHEPNECKCKNDLKQYIRKGKKLWLCSCCELLEDELVEK